MNTIAIKPNCNFDMLLPYRGKAVPSCTLETITPERAAEYLTRNLANRAISPGRVALIIRLLQNGEMMLNGDTIRVDWNGVLADGQHRLTAVVQSGIPLTTFVVTGINPAAFTTIDVNKPRNASDIMSILGKENYKHLAAALRLVYASKLSQQWTGGGITGKPFTNEEARKAIEEHPGIEDSVRFIMSTGLTKVRKFMAASPAIFMHYWLSSIDRDRADEFFNMINSGEYLYKGHPVLTLREVFVENEYKANRDKISRARVIAYTFKAWNKFIHGKEMHICRLSAKEKFPTPEGAK